LTNQNDQALRTLVTWG